MFELKLINFRNTQYISEKPPIVQPPKSLDQVRDKLRVKYYAIRTEEQYFHWIKRFILFHGKLRLRRPKDLGAAQIEGGRAMRIHSALFKFQRVATWP